MESKQANFTHKSPEAGREPEILLLQRPLGPLYRTGLHFIKDLDLHIHCHSLGHLKITFSIFKFGIFGFENENGFYFVVGLSGLLSCIYSILKELFCISYPRVFVFVTLTLLEVLATLAPSQLQLFPFTHVRWSCAATAISPFLPFVNQGVKTKNHVSFVATKTFC